jgi:hypothetical protein
VLALGATSVEGVHASELDVVHAGVVALFDREEPLRKGEFLGE